MAQGMDPEGAAVESLRKITHFYPDFSGAVVAVDRHGNHGMSREIELKVWFSLVRSTWWSFTGAACHGFTSFQYSLFAAGFSDVILQDVSCRHQSS